MTPEEKAVFVAFVENAHIDPWEGRDECDPNPSDSFEQGASAYKEKLLLLLETED